MKRFKSKELNIDGVHEITHLPKGDERGYLTRLFCSEEIKNFGFHNKIVQINRTFTKHAGTIRGMHFQLPPGNETKIIICIKGEIFDVVVDVRKNSKTFLKYTSLKISNKLNNMIFIPKGFAHGFQTLSNDVELIYLHDKQYFPELEKGLNPLDPKINIDWPNKSNNIIISKRDQNCILLENSKFEGI